MKRSSSLLFATSSFAKICARCVSTVRRKYPNGDTPFGGRSFADAQPWDDVRRNRQRVRDCRSAQSRSASGRYSSNRARNRIEVIVFARQRFGTSGPSLPPPGPMPEPLTSTKVQIPELLGRGFTQQEIAIRLARRAFTMTGRSFARHRTSAFGHLVVRPLLAQLGRVPAMMWR